MGESGRRLAAWRDSGAARRRCAPYLELEVELVLWVREPIPLELGIWSADQLS